MHKILPVIFLFAVARLLAVTPVPFTEGASVTTRITGTLSATLTIYGENTATVTNTTSGGTNVESTVASVSLRPGRSYTMNMTGSGSGSYQLSFIAPSGYSVYIDSLPADLLTETSVSGSFSDNYTVELRPSGDMGGGPWGSFSGIAVGQSITWEVGLGDLRTGRSAGGIFFKELDLTSNPASRERLYYFAPPANVGQIVVIKDGPSNQTLRQVVSPGGFTDLVDITGGYEIRCYTWGQVASWNGTLYSFSGSPWKTIKVESPAANQLKITVTEGAVVQVSLLTGTGTFGPVGGTGGTVTASGSYTVHTFNSGGTFNLGGGVSSVDYLVVGGGGGGSPNGGGGGGGSVEYLTGQSISPGSYPVVVGNGGSNGVSGGNSSFRSTIGYGGYTGAVSNFEAGGGSGGGGGANIVGASAGSGSNVYPGGGGNNSGAWDGGGGGGAGGNTQNQSQGGGTYTGGNGLSNSITGTAVLYGAGGGGGNAGGASNAGGNGGGGAGGYNASANGNPGAANTGSGGGGAASGGGGNGGNGGSGVVIIRYLTPSGSGTPGNFTWTLEEGNGSTVLRTTKHTSSVPTPGQRDDVVEVRTGTTSGTLVAKTKYHYVTQAWGGEELASVIADPDSSNPNERTTTYDYWTNGSALGNYRKVKSVTEPTGRWTAYEYYDDFDKRGQLKYEFHPYVDSPAAASSASPTTGRVVYSEYTADWTGRHRLPSLRQESTTNIVTAKTTWTPDNSSNSGSPRVKADAYSYRDASNSQTTRVENIRADADPDEAGQPYAVKNPDQSQSSWSVARGTFDNTTKVFTVGSTGDHWRQLKFNGSTNPAGAEGQSTYDGQSFETVYMVPNKSTLEVTIRIAQGVVYRQATYVYTGNSNYALMTYEDFTYDGHNQLTQRLASNGALTTYSYTDGQLRSTTDPTGTETQFTYDILGRVATTIKKGASASGSYAAQGDITTTHTYDGANRVTQTVTSGGSLSQTTTGTYDLAGRLTQSVAPGGYTTGYAYSSGGKIITATLPGGATRIDEVYLDGQTKSQTGTAVVAQYFGYTVNPTPGTITRQVNSGTSSSTHLVKTTADWLGRTITEVRPGWNGSDVTATNYYNSSGQLYKVSRPGMADSLYSYDTLGGLVREGLDIGANGLLDLSSSDRITDHAWTIVSGGGWWLQTTNTTYATSGSGAVTQTSKTSVRLDLAAGYFDQRYLTDVFGNSTYQSTTVDRANKILVNDILRPDSSTWGHQVTYNGLLVSSRDTTNITTTYGYDALGRPVTSVDPRTGTTTTAYVTGTSQVYTVTDPASIVQATYTYDSAGRVSSVKDALNKYTYTSYTSRGEVYRQWGDATYPVEYAYDNWGRRTTMNTYRGGSGWTGANWPSSTDAGTADVTKWNFHEPTGLLSSKVSAYGTADAKTVSYTYTQAGQIDVRTWARGVTTDYGYSSTTGELLTVDYSDSTPDLTYTYNRLGNQATVTDVTGTRTLNYNLAGTLELQNEVLPSGYYGDRRITRGYSTTTGTVGRYNRLAVGSAASPYGEYDQSYGYDTYGRLNGTLGTYTYSYLGNSNLLSGIAHTTSGWSQTRTYLSNRDLLDVIETKISTTSKAKFDYALDNLGRRTSVAKTGEMFGRYGNGSQGLDTVYGYDDRSQLTSEQTKLGGTSTVLTGRDDGYAFDNIGNRASTSGTTHNGNAANYTTNALNQYTQRTVPGVFDVAGAAGSGATVTVNGSSSGVTRHGEYFFKGHGMANNPNPVYSTLAVSDGTTTVNLPAFTAGTPEAFVYDADGNLTSDGRWDYTYDAENRLVSIQTHTALSPSPLPNADARRIEFKNDYLGRRVEKIVRSGWNGSTFATVISDEKFVYDGWNMIARLNALSSNALVASYFWGLDWSGTLQGAGGVGGLLMVQEGGNSYLPMFDGNGNVMGMIKASDGTIAAAYEYDAFGNTLRESGTYAASNPFRFSTKYTDTETGLVYYGLRYYSPTLGRFLNQDPIAEQGGLNLYAFCGNNGVNKWDYLGQRYSRGDYMGSDMTVAKDPDWYDLYGDGGGVDGSAPISAPMVAGNGHSSSMNALMTSNANRAFANNLFAAGMNVINTASAVMGATLNNAVSGVINSIAYANNPAQFNVPNVTDRSTGKLSTDSLIANGGDLSIISTALGNPNIQPTAPNDGADPVIVHAGASFGGTLFIPSGGAPGALGVGVHAEINPGVAFDTGDIFNSRLEVTVAVAGLAGGGAAGYLSGGLYAGKSTAPLEAGFTPSSSNHVEAGWGGPPIAPVLVNGSFDWNSKTGDASGSFPSPVSAYKLRWGEGFAAYIAGGKTGSLTYTSPSATDAVRLVGRLPISIPIFLR